MNEKCIFRGQKTFQRVVSLKSGLRLLKIKDICSLEPFLILPQPLSKIRRGLKGALSLARVSGAIKIVSDKEVVV